MKSNDGGVVDTEFPDEIWNQPDIYLGFNYGGRIVHAWERWGTYTYGGTRYKSLCGKWSEYNNHRRINRQYDKMCKKCAAMIAEKRKREEIND